MITTILPLYSRIVLVFDLVLRRLHLAERFWGFPIYFLRKKDLAFTKSVYGPFLQTDWTDNQFKMSITGRSGFKLYDILQAKRTEPFIFIDVGANIGLYSLLADKNEHCLKVYAIEPNTAVLQRMISNVKYNCANKIEPLNVGIAESNGVKKLYLKVQ